MRCKNTCGLNIRLTVSDIESACDYKIGDSLNEITIETDVEFVCCRFFYTCDVYCMSAADFACRHICKYMYMY